MGKRNITEPPGCVFFHASPVRSANFIAICCFFAFFYGLVIATAIFDPRWLRLDFALLFCFLNPISWVLYCGLYLYIRNAACTLYVRPNAVGWSQPRLRGGDHVEEYPLSRVDRMWISDDQETKTLILFLEDGRKINVPEAALGNLAQFERAVRVQNPYIDIEAYFK